MNQLIIINKDKMIESELVNVESLDFSDHQTWLYKLPNDSGQNVDIVDWNLSCDWPIIEDEEYHKIEMKIYSSLDKMLKNVEISAIDKHKFDSRTYVKPKRRSQRPSIQSIVEVSSNPSSLTPDVTQSPSKYLTYNKYSMPLGPVSPMLRLKTFNVDTNTDNSTIVKDFAMKRRSITQDDDPQLEDVDMTLVSETSNRLSSENIPSKPINIDLAQPLNNFHAFSRLANELTVHLVLDDFRRPWTPDTLEEYCGALPSVDMKVLSLLALGLTNTLNERGSLNMYRSGESLMKMSPPSLVNSLVMENSGNFNTDSIDNKKSIQSQKDSGVPSVLSGRESIDPNMFTSMTLSILDEKDMSTSFLSQTTNADDSLMDSLPPSLVNSVNTSFVVSTSKQNADQNVFSSPTYTHLEQSDKLLLARPRCQLFNSFKKENMGKSESYTKAKEESCQMETTKILNENSDKVQSPKNSEMSETITLYYSNNKFKRQDDSEKENHNVSFEKDDAFYKDMCLQKNIVDLGKNSLNVTMDKQELNEIIQARQKLSLARKALPVEEKSPNHLDASPNKVIKLPNQTIVVPKQSMENASELLSRRRTLNRNNYNKNEEPVRETPKRNATFKKTPPKATTVDTTTEYVNSDEIIDINSATLNLIDSSEKKLQSEQWSTQNPAMVGSNESTDTGTFSSSSPPESGPDPNPLNNVHDTHTQVASTPLVVKRRGLISLNLQTTISPIFDTTNDQSYTKLPKSGSTEHLQNDTVINTATLTKKSLTKRDILANRTSPEKVSREITPSVLQRIPSTNTVCYEAVAPPGSVLRKSSLPTSKLRQYSSHKELNKIPSGPPSMMSRWAGRTMTRRGVYGSNPALSPTAPHPPVVAHQKEEQKEKPFVKPTPVLVRQGTETLRREGTDTIRKERPQSQLVGPRDLRYAGAGVPVTMRNHHMPPPTTRPYSIAGASQLKMSRPSTGPVQKPVAVVDLEPTRPSTGEPRVSSIARPSRLPAPRRTLRPPSVYSVAQTGDTEHY